MTFNNPDWKAPAGYSSTARTSNRMALIPKEHSGKKFHVNVFISRSPLRKQQAFGSLTIMTELGPLTMNGLAVRYDKTNNTLAAQTPFKAFPNKNAGGSWNVISNEYGDVWQVVGTASYQRFFDNEAAGIAAKLFYEAYAKCSKCEHCHDMDPIVVNRIIDRIAEIKAIEAPSEKELDELDNLSSRLASSNKSCCYSNTEQEATWSIVNEDISCSEYFESTEVSDACMESVATLFNLSAAEDIQF